MPMLPQDPSRRLSWGNLLTRILVGWVFLSEGCPEVPLSGRVGYRPLREDRNSWPQFFAPFVGVEEIVCGILLLLGVFTSLASVLLLIDIAVAIVTTKFPVLFKQGFWATLLEARRDFCMFFGLIAILIMGGGYILSGLP
jgi:putative oxidoreductase